jgi:microcystin-dependent protein
MADPFVAEIRIFPFNFPPKGWAWCDGQLMPISQNTALFSLLGTTYGGDGKATFALPDLDGSAPMMWGQGAGLSNYDLGQSSGTDNITLLNSEMPIHNHIVQGNFNLGDLFTPSPTVCLANSDPGSAYSTKTANIVQMNPQAIGIAGGGLPHNNMMPFLTVYFNIALQGVFPPRT